MTGKGGAARRAMPYTLPLLVAQADRMRPAASGTRMARDIDEGRPRGLFQPTLIISTHEGWVAAARGVDFLVPADLAVEDFFAADIAQNRARK